MRTTCPVPRHVEQVLGDVPAFAPDPWHDLQLPCFVISTSWEDSGASAPLLFAPGDTEKMRVTATGCVGIGTAAPAHKLDVVGTAGLSTGTAWTNTSDSRIKTNVQTITGALLKIKQLRPVSFQYNDQYLSIHDEIDGTKTYNSFVAEEYEDVFPDAVSIGGNLEIITDEETDEKEILIEDLKQFTPTDLPIYLVAAVQELSDKVDALSA